MFFKKIKDVTLEFSTMITEIQTFLEPVFIVKVSIGEF